VFLLDPIHADTEMRAQTLKIAKELLEDESIMKIIHDCRQDSDALYRAISPSIKLANVFDTQVWHLLAKGGRRKNLNDTLVAYNLPTNAGRYGKSIYDKNPNFWKDRPLTIEMIQYASKDVFQLFELRKQLIETAGGNEIKYLAESNKALEDVRSLLLHELVSVPPNSKGRVIGKGGSTISSLEESTGCMVYGYGDGFLVIASNQSAMNSATRKIRSLSQRSYY
jgi:DNA polymerase I-like protein with 3'-5' exonuclease and polymerase domains